MPSSPSSAEAPGRVVSGHGRRLVVEADDGHRILCHTRGKRSDAVVGDRVRWQASGDGGVIDESRPGPRFSEPQRARALIAAAEAGIAARIILNKRDLPAFAAANERLAPYL